MATRAIHLEIGGNLSASSTIMAVQRLAGRRGVPSVIYSDQATNFRKASKELRDAILGIDREEQERFAGKKRIKWHFNPPDAPHMGGAWERLIKSVKTALDHVLRGEVTSEETLYTLFIEIEHSVNSRPLTHVSVDPRDEEALTPNHFLIGSSSGQVQFEKYENEVISPRRQFQLVQSLAKSFWKRWLREYLPTLLPRKKWPSPNTPLKIGDVVLIIDYQSPRNEWKKGKVSQVFPDGNGAVRVVKVRLFNGKEYERPAHKLVKIFGIDEVQD